MGVARERYIGLLSLFGQHLPHMLSVGKQDRMGLYTLKMKKKLKYVVFAKAESEFGGPMLYLLPFLPLPSHTLDLL